MVKHAASIHPFPQRVLTSKSSSLKATIMDQSGLGRKRIGEILSKEGYITSRQFDEALRYQEKHFGQLGSILVKLGYVDEEIIINVLNRRYNYPIAVLSQISPDPKALDILPYNIAKQYMAFPLKLDGETLKVAMSEPTDSNSVQNLQIQVQKDLSVFVSSETDIIEAYRVNYKIDQKEYSKYLDRKKVEVEDDLPITEVDDFGSLVSEAMGKIEVYSAQENEDTTDVLSASAAPIIKLVNGILFRAIKEGVSDIHIEPYEKSMQVRYRVDGSLYIAMNLPRSIKNALTSRIKILCNLNISERRIPQDGRFKLRIGKRNSIDLRVSTTPTLYGEKIVMRILDKSILNIDLRKLGFEPKILEVIKKCISRPYGLLIVTGPTGSGKTTTLYSILDILNKTDVNIMTVEDPVEFNFKGINQVDINNATGVTFPAALRSFLRQDPDIIMIGEIRDQETAEIAIKAAMTGHLVLSTLHTNDCPSAIVRLVDIGIPPYMLAASLTMVLSQRLIKKLCPKCKVPANYKEPEKLQKIGFSKKEISTLSIYAPKGCPKCNNIGYKGRVGLFELMPVTDEIGKAINANAPEHYLRRIAIREGMIPLRDAGLEKIRQGVTSIKEIMKKTAMTKEALPSYLVNPEFERYSDRDVIIREGAHDRDFFSLVQGSLLLVKKGIRLAEIKEPGEFFGLSSAITGKHRSSSIISNGRSTIKRFSGDKLPEIIEQYPDVTKKILKTISNRLRYSDGHIEKLLRKPINKSGSRRINSIKNRRCGVGRRKSNGPWTGTEQRHGFDRRQAIAH